MCKHCLNPELVETRNGSHIFVCTKCGLAHNKMGEAIGWLILIGKFADGYVTIKELYGVKAQNRKPWDIAAIIRIAAQIGLENPEEVQKRLEMEDKEDVEG